jgi:hypothetical protein
MWTLLRTAAVAVGSSAALLAGADGLMGTAHADSEQSVPGDQAAPDPNQVLQRIAMALPGAQSPASPQPQTQPLASAAIGAPQPASAALPGGTAAVAGLPGTAPALTPAAPGLAGGLPGMTPTVPATAVPATVMPATAAAAPTTGAAGLVPSAQLDLPQLPFLPVPLPQQVSLPGDLASLIPGAVPQNTAAQNTVTPGTVIQGAVPQSTVPRSTAAATVPAGAPVTSANPLLPLSALP